MLVAVETGLETAIQQAVQENVRATRVTNVLLLAQTMGLDPTEPIQRQKVMRYLSSIEDQIRPGAND